MALALNKIAKYFDSVNHRMVSKKLLVYSGHPNVIGSIHSFLSNCILLGKADDVESSSNDMWRAVHQESGIQPSLVLNEDGLMFADDLRIIIASAKLVEFKNTLRLVWSWRYQ